MLKVAAVSLLCLALAGCGAYRPLYGKAPDGTSIATSLRGLTVTEQHTRAGQVLRNEILDGTEAGGVQRYNLKLDVTEHTTDVASLSGTFGTRTRYNLTARYELFDSTTGKTINSGSSFSNVEYDVVNIPVSDLSAADNARMRAAKELGQDIKLRVAAYLASQKS
jgi:LPS-assembly lipoprotein